MNEMTIQSVEKQQNLLAWSQRVAECRSSGLSVNRWCAEHNIRPKTYYNWQKKVFAAMMEQRKICDDMAVMIYCQQVAVAFCPAYRL